VGARRAESGVLNNGQQLRVSVVCAIFFSR
jgi:hypothetical protein